MLPQAFWISLRVLFFRAGPEDLPYDNGRVLSFACIAFGILANCAVAMVSALRETSTVFAVIIGVVFLHERLSLTRLASTLTTLVGTTMLKLSH